MNVITGTFRNRDKYGRSVQNFTVNGRTVAVVVTLPKTYFETYGSRYLVNDRASETTSDVTYYVKRAEAVAHAGSVVARESAKEA